MKKAIVTGANGFVGSAIVKELLKHNIAVIALVRNKASCQLEKSTLLEIYEFNLNNIDELEKYGFSNVDAFYHFAWEGSAGDKRGDIDLQLKNIKWTVECMKYANSIGCEKFICAGSIMEKEIIMSINQSVMGINYIYGLSKFTAHHMCEIYAKSNDINLIWCTITNIYGPGELSPRFINTTLKKIILKESLKFTAGQQIYDFIFIDDAARAFYLIGEKGCPFKEYIIGSSEPHKLKDYILDIKNTIGQDCDFEFGNVPFTGISLKKSDFDTSPLEKDVGFVVQVAFTDGIILTKQWLEKRCTNAKI